MTGRNATEYKRLNWSGLSGRDMKSLADIHGEAMDAALFGSLAKVRGDIVFALALYRRALKLETEALGMIESSVEPTYSILTESVAALRENVKLLAEGQVIREKVEERDAD